MFIKPQEVVSNLVLSTGMVVGDFGIGSGAFTEELAREVGKEGKVYAVDIQKNLLERVRKHFLEININNTEFIFGDLENKNGSKLADNSLDLVLLSAIFFQVDNDENLAQEAVRVVKPGGRIVVIDWKESFTGIGPSPDLIFNEHKAIQLFSKFNTEIIQRLEKVGKYHYGVIFRLK